VVEVLLAIAILALAAGMILVAIVRVREAAEKSRSQNNLKQIVLAVHNFSDAYRGHLPTLFGPGPMKQRGLGMPTLFLNIYPFVEADYLFSAYLSVKDAGDYCAPSSKVVYSGTGKDGEPISVVGGIANQVIRVYVSPADRSVTDGGRDATVRLPDGATGYFATCSYAANGLVFGMDDPQFPRSFGDGVSYTILFAERPQVCQPAGGPPVYNLWGYGAYGPQAPAFALLTPDDPPNLPSTGQIAPALPLPAFSLEPPPVRIGRTDAAPQPSPIAEAFRVRGRTDCDPRIPQTPHPSGMLVAMADGTVRSLAPSISPWTFWAACTPAGGEMPGPDW
jgi:hypothetical protein